MVISSTNIKKNKQPPLNNDGQQFHQYQQNKQHPLNLNSLNIKKITIYDLGNPGSGFGQAETCGGVKSVNGIRTLPS